MLKGFRTFFLLLLAFGLSGMLIGDASEADQYFPDTLGNYWVYEDQDGNELTRRVVEGKEIAGKRYHAFSYEPAFEDSVDYDYHIHPNFYRVGEEWITFFVGDEMEKAVNVDITNEMKALLVVIKVMGEDFTILYDVEIEAGDLFYVLPTSVTLNEKWDATEIKAKVTMRTDPPQDPEEAILEYTIVETGTIVGKEKVETAAGTFEDCLKIEYQTKTEVSVLPPEAETRSPGESITTLWVAPNIGIVKFHQQSEDIFLKSIPLPPGIVASTTIRTLELKKYEVKSSGSDWE